MRVINSHRVGPNRFGDHCHSTSRVVETLRQTDPDDCLLFGRMSRFVSLAINVLKQDEATGRYAPLIAVTCLVFRRSIETHCQYALRHCMPIYCRAPDGMRVKRMFDAAYFADT